MTARSVGARLGRTGRSRHPRPGYFEVVARVGFGWGFEGGSRRTTGSELIVATEVKTSVERPQVRNVRLEIAPGRVLEIAPGGVTVRWDNGGASYGATLLCLLEEHVQCNLQRVHRSLCPTLEVPHSVLERLEYLLELCEAESTTEVLRRALATYESEVVIRLKEKRRDPTRVTSR